MINNILTFPLRKVFEKTIGKIYKEQIVKTIASLCDENSKILDVGCGDGTKSQGIMEFKPSLKIIGIDIQDSRQTKIPRIIYNGKKIPFQDNCFDIVITIDTLHHIKDITSILREIRRVTKRYIIIKDHLVKGKFSRLILGMMDFIVATLFYGVRCDYNYLTIQEWENAFKKLNLEFVEINRKISGKYNVFFKLEKITEN